MDEERPTLSAWVLAKMFDDHDGDEDLEKKAKVSLYLCLVLDPFLPTDIGLFKNITK